MSDLISKYVRSTVHPQHIVKMQSSVKQITNYKCFECSWCSFFYFT